MTRFKQYIFQLRRRFWWRISLYAGLSCLVAATLILGAITFFGDYLTFQEETEEELLTLVAEDAILANADTILLAIKQSTPNKLEDTVQNIVDKLITPISNDSKDTLLDGGAIIELDDDAITDFFWFLSHFANVNLRLTIYDYTGKELASASSDDTSLFDDASTRLTVTKIPLSRFSAQTPSAQLEIYAAYDSWKVFKNNFGVENGMWETFILLATFAGVLSGFISGRHITKRLDQIASVTKEWAAGHLSERINDTYSDEFTDHAQNLNRMADDLNELVLLRQELSAHNEREHLSKELHDTVKQQVFALALQIKALSKHPEMPDILKKRVQETEKTVAAINSEIVSLLSAARPSSTTSTHFIEGLVTLKNRYNDALAVTLICEEKSVSMSQVQEHQLLRITQEALNNCIKHSKATEAVIHFKRENNIWSLTIRDNGIGFDRNNINKGFGLTNIQERAISFHGTLTLDSKPGHGCSICVSWKATVQTSKV